MLNLFAIAFCCFSMYLMHDKKDHDEVTKYLYYGNMIGAILNAIVFVLLR